jgi:hypothetical protein
MKKNTFFALIVSFLLAVSPDALAITPPDSSPTGAKAKLDDLKDRLATKVAQLQHLERRAVFGTVKSTSEASILVETATKDLKIELTDDITVSQIIKGKRTKLTTDDLDKGDTVAVIGNYDATLDVLKAQIIVIQNQNPTRLSGIVESTDAKAYTITMKTSGDQSVTVDYETSTRAFEWTSSGGQAKAGFSKITAGQFVSVLGFPVPKKENRISSTRIIVLSTNKAEPSVTAGPTAKVTLSPTQKAGVNPTPTIEP